MPETLRYGDPPTPEECASNPESTVPATLELNLDPEGQQREIGISDLIGTPLTKWARARYAVRMLEKKGGNQKMKIKGLGLLVVGPEGWAVL